MYIPRSRQPVSKENDPSSTGQVPLGGLQYPAVPAFKPVDTDTGYIQRVSADTKVVQRVLTVEERTDKLRILSDYVQFTPPFHESLLENYIPPATKVAYKLKLIGKITSTEQIRKSLKSKANLQADHEDDLWNEGSFNVLTLIQAIDAIYNDGLGRIDGERLIGRTDEEFDRHDCVWAAVAYGQDRDNTLDEERLIAAEHSSREGEVEDSILYRIMEDLGWDFKGEGTFNEMFPPLRPGIATFSNIRGHYDGRYIISEDVNAGGTQGHVLAVDVIDMDDGNLDNSPLGYRRVVTFTDRQHERQHHQVARANPPMFNVYVWKVGG